MNTFELPAEDGKPQTIADFKIYLHSSPPLIKERIINRTDSYITSQTGKYKIEYKDAPLGEGYLNICVIRAEKGTYHFHIFGKIKGAEFHKEKTISDSDKISFGFLYRKVRYVLLQSRNILRVYYTQSNLKSMEEHLMAFLVPA